MKSQVMVASLFSLSLLSVAVSAAAPEWNLVELSYAKADIDDADGISPAGFNLSGSALLGDSVFLKGDFTSLSDDFQVLGESVDVDLDWFSAGLGYRYAVSGQTDLYGIVSYESFELKASLDGESESGDDNGYGLTVGVRSMLTGQLELDGSISYIDIDESETLYRLGANYYFTPQLSVGASYRAADDFDIWYLGGRFTF
ncbi:porin family protein [Bowmanella dokdonensis]|uniref:Porin family protein n=1 Tax=Bowmanella dokdonensis TaxID=751969 RepID=A0A939DK54_9ALTE|nr:porin family protein [Bowmanella dokdonensis]MBN7824208.1 porin family protein [Bowmanella dokdonensis]